MINIYVKSFNRAYYLDRCLTSIKKCVCGNYKIIVLDDGTPEKYLQKIKQNHPEVIIKTSENYDNKISAIEENLKSGAEINGFQIPTDLWKKTVESGTDYMIMTEDDVWFTKNLDLDKTDDLMSKLKMVLIKIGWISEQKINSDIVPVKDSNIEQIKVKIFSAQPFFMDLFFANKFYFFSILNKLGIVNKNSMQDYWTLNALLMGVFRKDYWLYVWQKIDGRVNEKMQLKNAVQWYRRNKNKTNYGKLSEKIMNTTFVSSATNSYHSYNVNCDINIFNHIMNEEWYHGHLQSMQGYPKDIPDEYYAYFLKKHDNPRCTADNWKLWAEKFKEQYRKQKVDVE